MYKPQNRKTRSSVRIARVCNSGVNLKVLKLIPRNLGTNAKEEPPLLWEKSRIRDAGGGQGREWGAVGGSGSNMDGAPPTARKTIPGQKGPRAGLVGPHVGKRPEKNLASTQKGDPRERPLKH